MGSSTAIASAIAAAFATLPAQSAPTFWQTDRVVLQVPPAPPTQLPDWFQGQQTETNARTNDQVHIEDPTLADRATTHLEEAIGEIRQWALLTNNWDGEGAGPPIDSSLQEATSFICALPSQGMVPEPMLHPSGRAGLYWNDATLYADLEFTGNGEIVYYIERRGEGKHKGVVNFDGKKMPLVFTTLLRA